MWPTCIVLNILYIYQVILSTLLSTPSDCPGLIQPGVVRSVRDSLINTLEAHICAKSDNPARLCQLLSLMPQVRLMTLWYNNLMKKMSLPAEMANNKSANQKPASEQVIGSPR